MYHWFLTLPLLLLPTLATAASLTVSPGQSIAAALSQMAPSDTLTIQGGTYTENNLTPPSGSTVQGEGSVVIRPTGGTNVGFALANNVTLRNIKIDGSGGGISYGIRTNGQGNLIENVEIANVQNQGIALYCPGDNNHTGCGGGGNTVRNVYSHGAGSAGCHGTTAQDGYCHGIYIYSDNNVIDGGEFAYNNGFGIQTYGSHTVIQGASVHDNAAGGVTIPGYRAFPNASDQLVMWDGSSGSTVPGTPRGGTTPGTPPSVLPAPRNFRVMSLP